MTLHKTQQLPNIEPKHKINHFDMNRPSRSIVRNTRESLKRRTKAVKKPKHKTLPFATSNNVEHPPQIFHSRSGKMHPRSISGPCKIHPRYIPQIRKVSIGVRSTFDRCSIHSQWTFVGLSTDISIKYRWIFIRLWSLPNLSSGPRGAKLPWRGV